MPDYKKSIQKVKKENPDVADASINEAGSIARFFANRRAGAFTNSLTGNITYFPERMNQAGYTDNEIDNTFTHELQHTRQIRALNPLQRLMMIGKSLVSNERYLDNPIELDAFQAEKDRSLRLGLSMQDPTGGNRDIQLPAKQTRGKY